MSIKYSLVVLATCATIGMGTFIYGIAMHFLKRREATPPLMMTAFIFSAAGFAALVTSLGNPARILNILSNPASGFSIVTLGLLLLTVLSFALCFKSIRQKQGRFYLMAALGIILTVCLYYGLVLMFSKPARPALNSWYLPVFILSAATASGGYTANLLNRGKPASGGKYIRIFFILLRAAAVAGFLMHLSAIGFSDRYLSLSGITGGSAGILLFAGVIGAGIVAPLVAEILFCKRKTPFPAALLSVLLIISGSTTFFMIINIVTIKSGNMV